MNRKRSKLISLMLAIAVVVSAWSAWDVNSAEAASNIFVSGMFGFTGPEDFTGPETARAYVVNIGDENGVIAIIKYLDLSGNVLAESGEIRLALGQGGFFDLNADDLDFSNARRVPIRVEIRVSDLNIKKFRNQVAISSVEIFESSSGKTISIVGLPFIEQKN